MREEGFYRVKKINIVEVLELIGFSNCNRGVKVDERERLGLRLDLLIKI